MITESSKKIKGKKGLARYRSLYFKIYGDFYITQIMLYSYTVLFQLPPPQPTKWHKLHFFTIKSVASNLFLIPL